MSTLEVVGIWIGVVTAIIGAVYIIDNWLLDNRIRDWILHRPKVSAVSKIKSDCKALILAAGKSMRWLASIQHIEDGGYYSSLWWENVNNNLKDMGKIPTKVGKNQSAGLSPLRKPPKQVGSHKALALLNGIPLILYAFTNYLATGVKDISVVVSAGAQAQKDLQPYIDDWNKRSNSKINEPIETDIDAELAYSAYRGLSEFLDDQTDLIVSYSDIIWNQEVLLKLLNIKGKDIVIVVDKKWQKNYPMRRIWHDTLYAELVWEKNGKINRIGEAVNNFDELPEWSLNNDRVKQLSKYLNSSYGEIVGLFKFSLKGRISFCETLQKLLPNDNINVDKWIDPNIPYPVKSGEIPIQKALLGSFLEYLSKQDKSLNIELLPIKGGWVEIDHWGDISIAEDSRVLGVNPVII